MRIAASAPGKAVLLGEYAVLDGARALVIAVDRRCRAEIGPAAEPVSSLRTLMPDAVDRELAPGRPSGVLLVDALVEAARIGPPWPAWSALIDSSALFAGGRKLGLGSSAAALVAFAGAWWAAAGKPEPPGLRELVRVHRAFQGGAGSGIDVAAALAGGALEFRLNNEANPEIGSVRLPKSVGFAGIFAGGSASTPNLVGQYRQFAEARPAKAAALRQRMGAVADDGCAAARGRDGASLVAAVADYGRCLQALGEAIGADIVTSEHRAVGRLAGEFDLAYKVSGAGGGDLGLAVGLDAEALAAFSAAAAERGLEVIPLAVGEQGLTVEEHAE